jgi:hypothetical protein
MKEAEKILEKMEQILDQIVANAEKMKELSLKSINEKELTPLQHNQDELVLKLQELDAQYKNAAKHQHVEHAEEISKRIESKLNHFQQVNASFIENLRNNQKVVRFEVNPPGKPKKE